MKIVNFTPGLGNQIFEYIFVQYLKKISPKENVYGYYNPRFLNKHNGLEVHKYFDIKLPPETKMSNAVAFICRALARFVPGIKATDNSYSEKAIYYDGWWQNKYYFLDTIKELHFVEPVLDEKNISILTEISSSDSVSIHVRRGDYLEPKNAKQYGGICTLEYYKKAIAIIKSHYKDPNFYIFSNDIQWCKENLNIKNAVFVSNNTGKNSWLDMYLMSKCRANILANSSFSYWGAMMNKGDNIVIYPEKWINDVKPDIFLEEWTAI